MNSVYNHAVKQFTTLRRDLTQFEQNITTSPLSLQGSIAANLSTLTRTITEYETLMKNEIDEVKLEKARLRLSNFNNDIKEIKTKFQELKRKRDDSLQEANKSELLNRRPHNQASSTSDNPYETNQQQQSTHNYRESMAKEHDVLNRGLQQLDDILEMGRNSYEELVASNSTLRNIGTRISGTMITLGVSNQTMRSIERRVKQDKWIFWGGAFAMFLIFYLLIRWLR